MNDIFRLTARQETEMVARLLLAAVSGAVIGWQREQAAKPAGLRTLTLVSVGSAIFTIVSILGFGPNNDPSRVAAQIVSGIGFLGAGAILRLGTTVRGLTTAASIWAVAAIGMAVGAGMYVFSVLGTLLLFVILNYLPRPKE